MMQWIVLIVLAIIATWLFGTLLKEHPLVSVIMAIIATLIFGTIAAAFAGPYQLGIDLGGVVAVTTMGGFILYAIKKEW